MPRLRSLFNFSCNNSVDSSSTPVRGDLLVVGSTHQQAKHHVCELFRSASSFFREVPDNKLVVPPVKIDGLAVHVLDVDRTGTRLLLTKGRDVLVRSLVLYRTVGKLPCADVVMAARFNSVSAEDEERVAVAYAGPTGGGVLLYAPPLIHPPGSHDPEKRNTWRQLSNITLPVRPTKSLRWSPDGSLILVSMHGRKTYGPQVDSRVVVLQPHSGGQKKTEMTLHTSQTACFSADGETIICALDYGDGAVRCFDTHTGRQTRQFGVVAASDAAGEILVLPTLAGNSEQQLMLSLGSGSTGGVLQLLDLKARGARPVDEMQLAPLPQSNPSSSTCNNSVLTLSRDGHTVFATVGGSNVVHVVEIQYD